jgi:hypothetical protein
VARQTVADAVVVGRDAQVCLEHPSEADLHLLCDREQVAEDLPVTLGDGSGDESRDQVALPAARTRVLPGRRLLDDEPIR